MISLLDKLVIEMERSNHNSTYPLSHEVVEEIKDQVINERDSFSPFQLTIILDERAYPDPFYPFMERFEKGTQTFGLFVKPRDRILFLALEAILKEELKDAFLPCSFACRNDVDENNFLGEIVGWRKGDTVIFFDFSLSRRSISNARLL